MSTNKLSHSSPSKTHHSPSKEIYSQSNISTNNLTPNKLSHSSPSKTHHSQSNISTNNLTHTSPLKTHRSPSKEICSQSMSSRIFLHELKPANPERKTIRVRVVRMWQDYVFNDKTKQGDERKNGIGYIVADEKGSFAHAKLSTQHEETFKHRVIDQCVYDMSCFNVLPCKKGYNPSKTISMIRFDESTKLRPLKGTFEIIPTHKPFQFVKFEDVSTMLSNEYLTDFVGFVASISPVIEIGDKKKRELILQDHKCAAIKVVIWDEQLELFDENKVQDNCVLVVSSVSLSKYNDEITISTKPSTIFFYNLDIPEVNALKESGLSVKMTYVENDQPQYIDWREYRRTTLAEMTELYNGNMQKGVTSTCDCTITHYWKIWYYMACEQCLCGVADKNNKNRQYCKSCYKTTKTFQAYNADVEIADETHSYGATIWAPALENYFHVDVHDIPNMIGDGCELEHMLREKLEDKKGTFQISMKTYRSKMSLSVLKFSPLTNDVEQYSEDNHSLTSEASPKNQGLLEYSNMNNSSEVTTPSKGEAVVSKKRKAQRNLDDGKEQDGSEHDGGSDDGNETCNNKREHQKDLEDSESEDNSNEDESDNDLE